MTEVQARAAERAGRRLGLGLLGALVVLLATVPLAVLVRRENPVLVGFDERLSGAAAGARAGSDLLRVLAETVTVLGEPVLLTAVRNRVQVPR